MMLNGRQQTEPSQSNTLYKKLFALSFFSPFSSVFKHMDDHREVKKNYRGPDGTIELKKTCSNKS